MNNNNGGFYIPEVQKLVDALKEQPTDKDRISALEKAIADLAVMLVGGVDND